MVSIREKNTTRLTSDHSLVNELPVAFGQLTPEEAETHPQRISSPSLSDKKMKSSQILG